MDQGLCPMYLFPWDQLHMNHPTSSPSKPRFKPKVCPNLQISQLTHKMAQSHCTMVVAREEPVAGMLPGSCVDSWLHAAAE